MRNLLAAMFMLALPLAAHAAKPVELASIKTEQPVGKASLKKLFLHIYDVAFWSDSGDWQTPPYALSITYAMGFTADEMADRTADEMEHVSDLPKATIAHYADLLRGMYPTVQDGDRITAFQKDAESTMFYYNGKNIGTINDAGFAKPFFGIWLSPQSSEPEMTRQLLPTRH